MKVAMLAAEYPPKWGGIGVHAFNLSNALANEGHEVHVITRKEKGKPPEQPKGVKIHTVDWLKVPLWFILSYGKNALKKVESLSNEKFEVLHQHSPLIALKENWYDKIKIPLVSTMHGTWYMERKSLEKEPISA
ncbi:MAG: glycosyltransferase, partial [Thermoplasmata archaeon]